MNILLEYAARIATERYGGDDSLTPILAKVLLHDGILHALEDSGLLRSLVFQGGAAIQRAYGGSRLSEDLDFVCGQPSALSTEKFQVLGERFADSVRRILVDRYKLEKDKIIVSQPKDFQALQQETPDVQKWSIKIVVSEKRQPNQVVKVEVVNIPAHDARIQELRPFAPELQYPPVLANVESLREILADKAVALCCRPYVKYRDVYDVSFIKQQRERLDTSLIVQKLKDYHQLAPGISERIQEKGHMLEAPEAEEGFCNELSRFMSSALLDRMREMGMAKQMLRTSATLLEECRPAIQEALERLGDEEEENDGPSPC